MMYDQWAVVNTTASGRRALDEIVEESVVEEDVEVSTVKAAVDFEKSKHSHLLKMLPSHWTSLSVSSKPPTHCL